PRAPARHRTAGRSWAAASAAPGPRPRRRTELRGRGRRPSLRPLTAGALPMTTPSATIRERGTYRTLLPAEDWVTRAIPGGALLLMATVLSLLFANTP